MAITKSGEERKIEGALGQSVDIYNGDWEALKEVTKKWGFVDETSALRFALAILTKANDKNLSIDGENVSPAKSLLRGGNGD